MTTKTAKSIFTWQGKNLKGEMLSGVIEAHSKIAAKVLLRNQHINVKKLNKKKPPVLSSRNRIKSKDVTAFTRQLATLLNSGIPLVQALTVVAKGQPKLRMERLIEKIKMDVEAGLSFSEALKQHPSLINALFCNLVKTGEQVGALEKILVRLATYKEKTEQLKDKIKKALVYPLTIIAVALAVTTVILIFVVPQFQELFKGFGANLPYLTLLIIELSKFIQSYWWLVMSSSPLLCYSCIYAFKKKPFFRHKLEKLSLKLPLFGILLTKAAVARFSRTLATTFSAGIPIVEGLESVAYSTGNIEFENASFQIQSELTQGKSLSKALAQTHKFPSMVVQMIAIGEESGELAQMLNKVADVYEEEVDNSVNTLSTLIEPLLMLILGILIGGLIIAMYLPIFKMGSVI